MFKLTVSLKHYSIHFCSKAGILSCKNILAAILKNYITAVALKTYYCTVNTLLNTDALPSML